VHGPARLEAPESLERRTMNEWTRLASVRDRNAPNSEDPRNNSDAFEIRLLTALDDMSQALCLRERAYAEHGHIPDRPGTEFRDSFDSLPTTAIFGAFDAGRMIASMRLCFASDGLAALPCAAYYPALADVHHSAPNGLLEVSRLAIDPEIDNTSYRATLYGFMVRSAFAAARATNVSAIVVATQQSWVAAYKHLLKFEQVGEPAHYPPGDIPITLLVGRITEASKRAQMRNRFFRITDRDIAAMRELLLPLRSTLGVTQLSAANR
jgi:N-acyl-L-homoserine lactone synthetase